MSNSKNVFLKKILFKFSISACFFTFFSAAATNEVEDIEAEIEKLVKAEQTDKEDLETLQQRTSSEPPVTQEPKLPCPHVPECTG
jgi:hypothetical protein